MSKMENFKYKMDQSDLYLLFSGKHWRNSIMSKRKFSSSPDLLKLFKDDFGLVMKSISDFVNDVFNGCNDEQKKELCKNLHSYVQNCHCSEVSKRSNVDDHQPLVEIKKPDESNKLSKSMKRPAEGAIERFSAKRAKIDSARRIELPNEIWLKIINFMKTKDLFLNFSLVCKYFNSLAKNFKTLEHLEIPRISHKTQYATILKHLKESKRLKEISFSDSAAITKHQFKTLLTNSLKSHKNLKSIKVISSRGVEKYPFCHDSIESIRTLANNIQHLELHKVPMNMELTEIAKLRTLKTLKIFSTGRSGIVLPKFIIAISLNCELLETFSLNNIWCRGNYIDTHKEAFDTLFKERKNTLKSLTLCGEAMHDVLFWNLFSHLNLCQNLEKLTIKNIHLEHSDVLSMVELPKLKSLQLVGLQGHLFLLFRGLQTPFLRHLILRNCYSTRNTSKVDFIHVLAEVKFPVLERLFLKINNCYISETTLSGIIHNSPKLKSIHLQEMVVDISLEWFSEIFASGNIFIMFERLLQTTNQEYSVESEKISKSFLKQVSGNVLNNYHDMERRFLKWCEMNTWYSHQLSTLQLVHFQEKFEGNSLLTFQHHALKKFLQMFGNQIP